MRATPLQEGGGHGLGVVGPVDHQEHAAWHGPPFPSHETPGGRQRGIKPHAGGVETTSTPR
jgi:hypothetical protein